MQPNEQNREGSWAFRGFLLFVGGLICAFIAWLVWATIEFSPTVEKDIAKSLFASPLFQRNDLAVTNQASTCRTTGETRAAVPADVYMDFLSKNSSDEKRLELHRFRKERRVLDSAKSPDQWYRELGLPVMSISNAGIVENRALVCLELYAQSNRGMFVLLEHAGADYWRIVQNELAWQDQAVESAEEIPELQVPIVE